MNILLGAGNLIEGATKASAFGKKGLAVGAAIGIGSFVAGDKIDKDNKDENGNTTMKGALEGGLVAGVIQSGASSLEELYAFKNGGSVQALSSINSTTSASANIEAKATLLTKSGWGEIKDAAKMIKKGEKPTMADYGKAAGMVAGAKKLAPESFLTDILEMSMVNNEAPMEAISKAFSKDASGEGKKNVINKVVNGVKGLGGSMLDKGINSVKLADGKIETPWFATKPTEIKGKEVKVGGSSYTTKDVKLTGAESMNERMAKYVEHYGEMFDNTLAGMGNDKIKNSADYANYLKDIKPGALGTYKELKRQGIYGKDSTMLKRTLGLMDETMDGSPIWARTLDHQLNNKSAELTKSIHITTDGKKASRVVDGLKTEEDIAKHMGLLKDGESVLKITNEIKGGSKIMRGLALAADVGIMGGGLSAATYGVTHVAGMPFKHHKRKDTNSINSNSGVGRIGA